MTARPALGEDNGYCFRRAPETDPASGIQIELDGVGPSKWRLLQKAKDLLPENHRLHLCHDAATKRPFGFPGSDVAVHVRGGSAHFSGVMRCAQVWVCPVCARRISEKRREEIQGAVDNAIRQGSGVLLVTHTFPHGAGDVLADILDQFNRATRASKSGREAKALHARWGFRGEIKTLEVTHGQNGWHPHAHSIWVTDRQLSKDEASKLCAELYAVWRSACLRHGLPEPSAEHGVDVRSARYDIAQYLAKWGFATEIAGSSSKRGKNGSRTPWQLLADAYDGDPRAAWLFREFAAAFKGKRQIFWSRGLRDKLQLAPELTEQALLNLDDDEPAEVIPIDHATWICIRRARAQGDVLHLAVHDRRGLFAFLNQLRSNVPLSDGQPPGPREDWAW